MRPVVAHLTAAGFDLVQAFTVADVAPALAPYRLEDFGRRRALGLLVGNTRALWPAFSGQVPAGPDPLDRYTEEQITLAATKAPAPHAIAFGHHVVPGHTLPIQRLAQASGLCATSPSHLSVHPTFGPWLALRAALTFDLAGPAPTRPRRAPCAGCPAPCVPPLEAALAKTRAPEASAIAATWTDWVAVRDACPVGRQHRYPARQIEYHYLKDPELLK